MKLGMMFFLLLPILGTAYSLWRIWQMLPLNTGLKTGVWALLLLLEEVEKGFAL
ncbi:hypothetical protein [Hoylesella enoeca]|uniref:hypothetical protein n=1 Tax=Hoylesella enoeca TaxID=76123 RepID=UPI00288AD2FD|nr:hypothetical protein [Hoylesella enoeca]